MSMTNSHKFEQVTPSSVPHAQEQGFDQENKQRSEECFGSVQLDDSAQSGESVARESVRSSDSARPSEPMQPRDSARCTSDELIFLEPVLHQKIWGGNKLLTDFGYHLPQDEPRPENPIGECWAIAAHPHGDCTVASGKFRGLRLSELWEQHRELFGNLEGDRFPLMVKILDAAEPLSIQVHPNNEYAAKREAGSLGKRECWYVLSAEPGASIIVGQKAQNKEEFQQLVNEGRWDELLNRIPVKEGDFFDIAPGMVHAVCAGTVLLEPQQSSDITYRVYDYDRLQKDGSKRELHLKKSLDVIDFSLPVPSSGNVSSPEKDGLTHLAANDVYAIDRLRVNGLRHFEQSWPFLCLSVVAGEGSVSVASSKNVVRGLDEVVGEGVVKGASADASAIAASSSASASENSKFAKASEQIATQKGSSSAILSTAKSPRHQLKRGSHILVPSTVKELAFDGEMTLILTHLP